jgi:hypothetical protein
VADVVERPSAARKSVGRAGLQVENGRPRSAGVDLTIFVISLVVVSIRRGRAGVSGRLMPRWPAGREGVRLAAGVETLSVMTQGSWIYFAARYMLDV